MSTETSIYAYAKQGLAHGADRTAIWFYGRSISYGELFEKIDNVADHLYELGVREGTVVTIHLPNCPQAVMAIYAVAKLGGICNMVHALTPRDAVQDNMKYTESAFLITHLTDCTAKQVLTVDLSAHASETYKKLLRIGNLSNTSFEEMEYPCCDVRCFPPDPSGLASKCAFYLHSSGSTGKPKTIMLSHRAMNHCVDNTADFFENGDMEDQISLGVLPLFHGFGLAADVHRNIHFGSQLVMMARWDPKVAAALIKQHRVSLIVGVPAMFYSLLREGSFHGDGCANLKYCYTGGDNVSPELLRKMDSATGRKNSMFPGFGLTEATTMNCVNTYCHFKVGSAGFPVRNTSIAVMDDHGTLHSSGQGELLISSPTVMMGYFKDPDATKQTLVQTEGKLWTRTGDEVLIDQDGFLFFKDRIKNIIIHNGYNIYPGEVETIIKKVPGVKAVCVVGVHDDTTGSQNVRAVVVADEKTEKLIRDECARCLPRYAVPKDIVFVKELPINAMGKVDRLAFV